MPVTQLYLETLLSSMGRQTSLVWPNSIRSHGSLRGATEWLCPFLCRNSAASVETRCCLSTLYRGGDAHVYPQTGNCWTLS